jgi:hypothetical protein
VTRDGRLGLASEDLTSVRELPGPHPCWHFSGASGKPWSTGKQFVVSPTAKTIAISVASALPSGRYGTTQDVYSIRPGDSAWTCLAAAKYVKASVDFQHLADILDQLHDEVVRRGQPLQVMEIRRNVVGAPYEWENLLVLTGGTCLHLRGPGGSHPEEARTPLLVEINDLIRKQTGQPVVIFACQAGPNPRLPTPCYYFFTDQGLFRYDLDTSAVVAIALPDRAAQGAVVMLSDGERSPDFVRFGLLPSDGGATYRLNLKTGTVKPEGCINESIPLLYWASRTEDQNRAAIIEELRKAGQEWPLKLLTATRPAD